MKRLVAPLACFLILVMTSPSRGDFFIMKNGQVIEGKFVSYDPVRKTFVLIVDEKGTKKTLKESDLKLRVPTAKTTWERKADFLAQYEKTKKSQVKNTWEAHVSLGKWCGGHLLPEKKRDHYLIARNLRCEKLVAEISAGKLRPQDETEQRLKIAKWLERDLGLFNEAKEEYTIAYGIKRVLLGEEATPDIHYRLGKWCEEVELDDLALINYESALELNPKHSGAKSAVHKIKTSGAYMLKSLVDYYDKLGRAWHISVTIEEPVSKDFIEKWRDKIQKLSDYVWNITEGQFFIATCEIEDDASDGKIIVEKGKLDWGGMDNKEGNGVLAYCAGSGSQGWEVHCPGLAGVSVLAHECFHGVFGLPDEYYQNPMCECVMRSAPNPQKLCFASNHIGGGSNRGPPGSEGKDCWQIIKDRPEFKGTPAQPNKDWVWNEGGYDKQTQNPKNESGHAEGPRNAGGELRWQRMAVKEPPKTVFQILDK
jgi:hypothetical protein